MNDQRNPVKHELYKQAYTKLLNGYTENPNQDEAAIVNKLIVYGIKAIVTRPDPEIKTWEDSQYYFGFADGIIKLISVLTPSEFMNIFPIGKDYTGHKWEMKDYFYTRDYIRTLDPNKRLGENALGFLWEYMNDDINDFNVEVMGYVSDLRRMQGESSLMDEFAQIMGLKTYTKYTDEKGREFILDKENGKTIRVKKAKSRTKLRLVN